MSAQSSIKVFVSSGTSASGSAAIDYLLKSHPSVTIHAGVRDLSKANKRFPNLDSKRLGFSVLEVKQQTNGPAIDSQILKGFHSLILIPPQEYHNRLDVIKAYVDAAKAAGVKHIVFLSAPAASKPQFILGKNLNASEAYVRASGIPATFLQAVFFYENHFGNASSIKSQGAWYNPSKATAPIPQLSIADIGAALANVAVNSTSHVNKSYTIVGDLRSGEELAAVYSKAVGKPVSYVGVPDDAAINGMKGAGFPEFMAKGIVELSRDFEATKAGTYSTVELKALLGREPETFDQWVAKNVAAFK